MSELTDTLQAWMEWFETPGDTLPPALIDGDTIIGYHSRGFNSNRFLCRFKTEQVSFDVEILMNDRQEEENASALVKLAIIVLNTSFDEPIDIRVNDAVASYNGGSLEDFLLLLDKRTLVQEEGLHIIYP